MKELIGHRMLLPAFETWPTKIGFHDAGYGATFAQHAGRVLRLADAMRRQLGIKRADRVAIMATNSHQYLELYHAAFLGACIINPLNLRLAGKELQYILADSGAEVVFVDDLFAEHLLRNIAEVRADLPLRHVVLIGNGDVPHDSAYEDLIGAGQPTVPGEPEEEDPVVLMYTGGTTGLPKGALLDQRAEMLNILHLAATLRGDDTWVYLHQAPMFHAGSMGGVLGVPVLGGASVFLPLFDPGPVLELVEAHQVNFTVLVPSMLAMLLNHPHFAPERLGSLRDLIYAGSPMPAGLCDQVRNLLPQVRLWQAYGMTECSSTLTVLTPRDHAEGGTIVRSAGRPVLGVTVSVQDREGRLLGTGHDGEVCARGGNFMRGYWNQPQDTERAFRGGWYHTGDGGHLDERGYLYLTDRLKDMIVTGGENVYSIEVENAISTHPAVAEVAVIGIPHDIWGEQVHAIVVLHPGMTATEEEIKQHARRSVGGYKVPKSVEFRAEPLPLSGALKPLKRELRERYCEKLQHP